MTLLYEHQMARAGRTEEALGLGTFSSFGGGICGGGVVVLLASRVTRAALKFQTPESFSRAVIALVAVSAGSAGPLVHALGHHDRSHALDGRTRRARPRQPIHAGHSAFMKEGEIVEEGAPKALFGSPREARTREFLERFQS